MKNLSKIICALFLVPFILIGCNKQSINNNSNGNLTIVTSFYPMYITTLNIVDGIDGINLVNMTKAQTGCLHDYQLSPQDLKTLEQANIFVVNGAGMGSFMDKVISQQKDLEIISASDNISLLTNDDGEENPHIWVSISNNIKQVENIASQLSNLDPKNKDAYMKNADNYISKLTTLETNMKDSLKDIKNRDIITFHESFPYFADEFNLNIKGVIEREPGTDPTPKELEDTINTIKSLGINALFAEPQYSSKAADTISRETGSKVYTLDPIVTGDSTINSKDDYINKMKENLKTLEEALK